MTDISSAAQSRHQAAETADSEDSISFFSLLRKLGAFSVIIFLFHLVVPLPQTNQLLVSTLGIASTWYQDVPLAVMVAGVNALLAILAFKLVK